MVQEESKSRFDAAQDQQASRSSTTARHTPGPWRPSRFGFQVVTGDSWNTICTLNGGAQWEDGRGKYVQEYEWQNQEANARLIAAAPALQEFAQQIFNGIDTHMLDLSSPADDILANVLSRGREALRQSLGEQVASERPLAGDRTCDVCDETKPSDQVSQCWPMGLETWACEKCRGVTP